MSNNQPVKAILKDIVTNKPVAVFPHSLDGSPEEIEKKVFDWYYAQGCSNEEQLPRLIVEIIPQE